MEEEFDDSKAVSGEVALKSADILETLFPDVLCDEFAGDFLFLQNFRMHAHDEGFLVVASVKNTDAAAQWKALRATSQEILIKLFLRRSLEREYLAALGIYPGHNMLDRAVFTCGVHGLEDDDEAPFSFGVEAFLEFFKHQEVFLEKPLGFLFAFFAEMGGCFRAEIAE